MTLETRRNAKGRRLVVLVECPASNCDNPDLSDKNPAAHLLNKHDPEDFGLSELRENVAQTDLNSFAEAGA